MNLPAMGQPVWSLGRK